jgi:hypothetical protein
MFYVLLCASNIEHSFISFMSGNDICITMSLCHKIAPLNCKLEAVISSLKNAYLIQSEGNIFLSRVPIADGEGGGGAKNMDRRRHRFISSLNSLHVVAVPMTIRAAKHLGDISAI